MAPQKGDTLEELGFILDEDGSLRIEELVIPPAPIPALSTDVPITRLIITHLTVRNFKSYAGEQTIGPFDKNFTAVVGPNGSGKSNVIDSLMFVFGRKSKDIRAKKMTALIHKSDKYPNNTSCSVAVNFAMISDDQATNGENVKDSAFIVSRTVQMDGSSFYEICHKRVQYREVVRTLRAYGIDMEYNRFLIMQGEIESISLMSPKGTPKDSSGMLEYIEDIVGSHRLIEPINYFQAKADVLKVEESDKAKEVELFEKEKNELEGPKNKAISYLRLENKHVLCENSILLMQKMKIEKDLEGIVDTKKKFAEEMKSLKAEMGKVLESKRTLESDLAQLAAKHDSILKKREEYNEEFKNLVREDAANLLDIKHMKGKIQSSRNSMDDYRNEINKLEKQFGIFESETIELQKKKETFGGEKSVEEKKATEVIGTLKQETQIMQEQKDALERDLIKLKENDSQIKSEMDLIKSELSIYVSGDKKEREYFSKLESDLQSNLDSAKKEEYLVQEEANQVKDIEKEISSLKEQLSQGKEKELSLFQQHRETRQKWEEARSNQQNSRNSSSLLQGLMKAKASGKLPPGIYGRLGNLGAIDEQYDIAMSTACGRLDNLVTDTMTTAQSCVEYLKKNNLGYATFIALDQLKRYERTVHQKIVTPENIPRLFDLIRVNDPALLPAFYLAIGDTLVAQNLEQATRIGLGGSVRHRVVTLEGKIVEPSGAMVGGGSATRGKIGQKVVENAFSDAELAEMSARVNTLSRELFEVKQLGVSLEDKISQRTNKLSSLQHSLKKRSLHIKSFKEKVAMITTQVTDQKEKMKESTINEKKVSELEEKIKAKNKIYKKAVEETTVVEKKVSVLQAKILELSKGKFNKAKKTVDQLKKKLDEVNQAITKSTINMKTTKSKMKKLETKIEGLQTDVGAFEKELQMLKEKRDVLTEKGQEANELVQEHEEELVGYAEKQKNLKKEMATINEREHEMKRTEIEHKNTLKTYEASESEKRAYIRSLSSKKEKLKLTKVEDDPTVIPTLSQEEIAQLDLKNLKSDLDIMQVQLEDMSPDLSSIQEFKKKDQMYKMKLDDLKDVKKVRTLQEKRKLELYKKRLTEFMKAFVIICIKVKEIYMMLTDGGDAELELVNKNDPFKGGIIYSVRPPKKAWKTMSHLSGGEKTLSSLALVFSLHYYRTTPFYVMDEIDAALDERNVGIIGKYLLENQKNAQFIIVSLRNVMNELPEKLLGVIKINNCTKNLHLSSVHKWAATRRKEDDNEPSTSKST